MKHLVLIALINIVSPAYSQAIVSSRRETDSALRQTCDKLNSLTTFSYTIKRELNYPSEGYHNISEWRCYFDLAPTIIPVGFKYQIKDSASSAFFNGTEKFELNKTAKTIRVNNNPQEKDFKHLSYLYNSIITLRTILPLIISNHSLNKTVADTVINKRPFETVTINIGKMRIQNLGNGFDTMKTKYNFIYRITIDKISKMPIEVLQYNNLNEDFIKTDFIDINFFPSRPAENSWYYPTYINEYKQIKQKGIPQLIPVGSIAGDWTLPVYNEDKNISLSQLKGKVILLDFWFKNCGPCIESVPHLNAINKEFKNKKVEVVGINTWDSKKDVNWFCNNHKVAYTVLMDGRGLAEKYGVNRFPTVILIDKKGKILYSGGFDQSKIEQLIENAL